LSLLGPDILLCTLFSNTLSLCSFLNVSDQVSHAYKTTGKLTVLYILIFIYILFLFSSSRSLQNDDGRIKKEITIMEIAHKI
jgi:hypothetical protein